jgi:hypothetical protein
MGDDEWDSSSISVKAASMYQMQKLLSGEFALLQSSTAQCSPAAAAVVTTWVSRDREGRFVAP